jgi:hypothetical protein
VNMASVSLGGVPYVEIPFNICGTKVNFQSNLRKAQ